MSFLELNPDDYAGLSARALGQLVAEGRVSPVHLAELALSLARQTEPSINAYVTFLQDWALTTAAEREAEAREGRIRSALHGVPIAIKDNFYLKGFALSRGSRTDPTYIPSETAPMVQRLQDAGVVIIGKTTTPEFGWKGTGISPLTGTTRNPWNTARHSGGSSAGSAATVAARAVPLAIGTDAGGSIRIPASFCGISGFKPTLGRIPVWPGTVTENLSHAGLLSRCVDDIALGLELTAGTDVRDPQSYAANGPDDSARWNRLGKGALRIGILAAPFGITPDETITTVIEEALGRVMTKVVADYAQATIEAPLPRAVFETFWVTGRGIGFTELFAKHATIMDQGLVRLEALARRYTLEQYFAAINLKRAFVAATCRAFVAFDILLMPTMPLTAFDANGEVPPGGEAEAPLPWITWTPYTYPFNISGQPAMSVPCGLAVDGLPVALQIVGPWGSDQLVLEVSRRIEDAIEFGMRYSPPKPPAAT
jgi:aspartyl-tRNA(Asn)/glutamyl-tRNA(Gln) amidotransferase subunit A